MHCNIYLKSLQKKFFSSMTASLKALLSAHIMWPGLYIIIILSVYHILKAFCLHLMTVFIRYYHKLSASQMCDDKKIMQNYIRSVLMSTTICAHDKIYRMNFQFKISQKPCSNQFDTFLEFTIEKFFTSVLKIFNAKIFYVVCKYFQSFISPFHFV